MIHEKILLNDDGSAALEVYALDSDISYDTKKLWPAVIICPGGGYMITATKEGEAVAAQFLSQGFSCFVLRYSTFLKSREGLIGKKPDINENAYYPIQVLQLMESMHLIHENADRWSIDIKNIFTIGFSAGGHITGTLAARWDEPKLIEQLSFIPKNKELKPAGCIMAYPMLDGNVRRTQKNNVLPDIQYELIEKCLFGHRNPSELEMEQLNISLFINGDEPPMFIWHTGDDNVADSNTTTNFVKKLQESGVPCEYHLFLSGKHGLACANKYYAKNESDVNTTIGLWLPLAFNWLEKIRNI